MGRGFTGLLWMVVILASSGCALANGGDGGSGGDTQAFDLVLGDCFNAPGSAEVERVTVVACSEEHDFEIFHTFELDDGAYPGAEQLEDQWIQGCLAQFEGFVGSTFDESALDISAIFPTRESWNELGDREVLCSVTAVDGTPRSSSAAGSGA
ncbi:MAG: septum formation family protein [Actinomycetota bacterium]